MPVTRWKKARLCTVVLILILYLLIRIKSYEYVASVELQKVHPSDVWEFVADFSNMKLLNPTVLDFTILSESGNYEHWQYSVKYNEKLSHFPYLANAAVAHFSIKAYPRNDVYVIQSVHNTCLFMGYFCLQSVSEFKFSKSKDMYGAFCEEIVQYQCPTLLSAFCYREVEFQRKLIMANLHEHFSKLKALPNI